MPCLQCTLSRKVIIISLFFLLLLPISRTRASSLQFYQKLAIPTCPSWLTTTLSLNSEIDFVSEHKFEVILAILSASVLFQLALKSSLSRSVANLSLDLLFFIWVSIQKLQSHITIELLTNGTQSFSSPRGAYWVIQDPTTGLVSANCNIVFTSQLSTVDFFINSLCSARV